MRLRSHLVWLPMLLALLGAFISAQTADIADLQRKAAAGDAKAQFELAKAIEAKDPKDAVEWLRKSALQGYAGAQVVLGYLYQTGSGMPKDPHHAADWFRKAAKQSDKNSQNFRNAQGHLSEMLAQGLISKQEADWAGSGSSDKSQSGREVKTAKSQPFSFSEVETGLNGGITSKRMAALVEIYGVDFSLTAARQQQLLTDGADQTLVAAISSAKH